MKGDAVMNELVWCGTEDTKSLDSRVIKLTIATSTDQQTTELNALAQLRFRASPSVVHHRPTVLH